VHEKIVTFEGTVRIEGGIILKGMEVGVCVTLIQYLYFH
jgi:hypothetical protein